MKKITDPRTKGPRKLSWPFALVPLALLQVALSCGAKIESASTTSNAQDNALRSEWQAQTLPPGAKLSEQSRLWGNPESPLLQEAANSASRLWVLENGKWAAGVAAKDFVSKQDDQTISWVYSSPQSIWMLTKKGLFWEDRSAPAGNQSLLEVGLAGIGKAEEFVKVLSATKDSLSLHMGESMILIRKEGNKISGEKISFPRAVAALNPFASGVTSTPGKIWMLTKESLFTLSNPSGNGAWSYLGSSLQFASNMVPVHSLGKMEKEGSHKGFWLLTGSGLFKSTKK